MPLKIAPATKYGPKIAECHIGTSAIEKSNDTIVWTDTATEMRWRQPVVLSRTSAKSGIIGSARKSRLPVRYVLIAKKSHTSGDRKFGQMPRSLGYGTSQKNSHGRPRWMIGNIAPIISAK